MIDQVAMMARLIEDIERVLDSAAPPQDQLDRIAELIRSYTQNDFIELHRRSPAGKE